MLCVLARHMMSFTAIVVFCPVSESMYFLAVVDAD